LGARKKLPKPKPKHKAKKTEKQKAADNLEVKERRCGRAEEKNTADNLEAKARNQKSRDNRTQNADRRSRRPQSTRSTSF
jgi:hypothetical protein